VAVDGAPLDITLCRDGTGVQPQLVAARARAGHLGIVGMRERARAGRRVPDHLAARRGRASVRAST
jgi:hypothetical protein